MSADSRRRFVHLLLFIQPDTSPVQDNLEDVLHDDRAAVRWFSLVSNAAELSVLVPWTTLHSSVGRLDLPDVDQRLESVFILPAQLLFPLDLLGSIPDSVKGLAFGTGILDMSWDMML